MADDFVKKKVTEQIFPKPGAQRKAIVDRRGPDSAGSALRKGSDRRGANIRLAEKDLRVAGTGSGAATTIERGTIVAAPSKPRITPQPKMWLKATGAPLPRANTIGSSASILRKAGRLGKIAASGIAAYGAYKAWKSQ